MVRVIEIILLRTPGPWFNIKMSSYQCRKSHCGDKTVVRSSYVHNGISYTGKMASLYWFSPKVSSLCAVSTMVTDVLAMQGVRASASLALTHWGWVTHIRQWPMPSLVQIMACRLLGTKPLSEPLLEFGISHKWCHWLAWRVYVDTHSPLLHGITWHRAYVA